MATDNFADHQTALSSPGEDAFEITPHNTNDLAQVTRGIYVGVGGNLTVITARGTTVAFTAVPTGTILPIRASRVTVTGTTASGLVGIV